MTARLTASTPAHPGNSKDVVGVRLKPIPPHVIVLLGAAGDLCRRKLIPGLSRLFRAGLLPECRIVGTSLEALDHDGFRAFARSACDEFSRSALTEEEWSVFGARLRYVPQSAGASQLAAEVAAMEHELGDGVQRLHYLSVPPRAAQAAVSMLGDASLAERASVVMEKPFGTDLASARQLNAAVLAAEHAPRHGPSYKEGSVRPRASAAAPHSSWARGHASVDGLCCCPDEEVLRPRT